jgi:hypothetical protein
MITVSDITGKKQIEIESAKGNIEIDLSGYSNGVYLLEFRNSETYIQSKMIKK